MEYSLKILPRAKGDLNNIFDFIFKDALEESIAQGVIDDILRSIGTLKTFPSRWPDFEGFPGYRQMLVGKYKVIYKIEGDLIQIVRVKHTSQYQ